MKIKNRWKYSVEEGQFDGNFIFVLEGSQKKDMFVLNISSNPFHSLGSMLVSYTMYISLTSEPEIFPGVEIKWQIVILCRTNKKNKCHYR